MTFGNMIQQVCDRLGVRQTNANVLRMIKAQLNASYATIRALRNWDWLQGSAALAITSTSTAVALPTDCRSVLHVVLKSWGQPLYFQRYSTAEIEGLALNYRSRGTPQGYTVLGSSLYTIPLPAGSDTLDIAYIKELSDMVLNSDVPALPPDHHQLLVEDCVANLAAQDQYDPLVARAAWTRRNELLRALMHTGRTAAPMEHAQRVLGSPDVAQFPE